MARTRTRSVLRIGMVGMVFATGFVCGSVAQRSADAQLADVMKKTAEGGALGAAGDLGTAIVEMQDHVSGLQKNIDALKKVKTALGG